MPVVPQYIHRILQHAHNRRQRCGTSAAQRYVERTRDMIQNPAATSCFVRRSKIERGLWNGEHLSSWIKGEMPAVAQFLAFCSPRTFGPGIGFVFSKPTAWVHTSSIPSDQLSGWIKGHSFSNFVPETGFVLSELIMSSHSHPAANCVSPLLVQNAAWCFPWSGMNEQAYYTLSMWIGLRAQRVRTRRHTKMSRDV